MRDAPAPHPIVRPFFRVLAGAWALVGIGGIVRGVVDQRFQGIGERIDVEEIAAGVFVLVGVYLSVVVGGHIAIRGYLPRHLAWLVRPGGPLYGKNPDSKA